MHYHSLFTLEFTLNFKRREHWTASSTIFAASTSISFIKIHIFPLSECDIRGFSNRETQAEYGRQKRDAPLMHISCEFAFWGWRRVLYECGSRDKMWKRGTLKNALRLSLFTTKGTTYPPFSHTLLPFVRLSISQFFHRPRLPDWIDRRGEMHTCDRALHENARIMEIITHRVIQMGSKAFFQRTEYLWKRLVESS